jgi:hypothetical protein
MRDNPRRWQLAARFRRSLRERALRAIDEVVGRHHRERSEQIDALRDEVAQLREWLGAEIGELRAALKADLGAELRRETDRVLRATADFEHRVRRDLFFADEWDAATTSGQFARAVMPTAARFPHPHATLEHALTLAPSDGMALEFGVATGTTLKIIARGREGKDVYGFDSFEGLPEDWRTGFPAGMFGVDGLPDVPGAQLLVGWFDDTLPGFLAEHEGAVALLHVDCDLYSSTRTVLEQVGPRLRPGSVVVFDEYFNFPGWQDHEHKAWREYVEHSGTRFDYVGYTIDNEQVIIRVTE